MAIIQTLVHIFSLSTLVFKPKIDHYAQETRTVFARI